MPPLGILKKSLWGDRTGGETAEHAPLKHQIFFTTDTLLDPDNDAAARVPM